MRKMIPFLSSRHHVFLPYLLLSLFLMSGIVQAQTNTFPLNGYAGIGTTTPGFALTAIGTDWNSSQISLTTFAGSPGPGGTNNYTPQFRFEKARGTSASQLKVENGDRIGAFLAAGHDGSKMQRSAVFGFRIDAPTSTGIVPIGFFVQTGDASSNKPERFLVKSDGGVVIKDLGVSLGDRMVVANDTGLLFTMPIPTGGGGPLSLDDLTDVATAGAGIGDVLLFNGSSWTAGPASGSDNDWLYYSGTDNSGEIFHAGNLALGNFTDPQGHRLNSQNYLDGKGAVRGANQSGSTLYAAGMLGVETGLYNNILKLPIPLASAGVLGIKMPSGFQGAAVYGWNDDDNTVNYGGLFVADGDHLSGGINYGIYATADSAPANYAGYFKGRVVVSANSNLTDGAPDYQQTVFKAEVTHNTNYMTNAVEGYSVPTPGYGSGGYFTGGRYGAYAKANSTSYAGNTYGMYADATGTAGNRYALYGVAVNPGGNLAVGVYGYGGSAANNWAGYFSGNVYVSGDMRIGTTTAAAGYELSVDGEIACEEVLIELNNDWPDYVFEDDYALPSLEALARHIKEKGHLPNIPSAEDIAENGLLLGKMQSAFLEKIEELTLYTIHQDTQLKGQEALLREQEKAIQQQNLLLKEQARLLEIFRQELNALRVRQN